MASFGDLIQQIDSLKRRLDALRPLDREREARVMQKFRLWWTYHSNAIEGNSLTQGETTAFLMEGLTAKNKPLKDHLDLRGHNEAIQYLHDLVKNKEPLTEAVIRELHKILLVEPHKAPAQTPDGKPTEKTIAIGQYKTSPNHVRTPTGETHYYATPEDTPAKMHELMDWYRDAKAKEEMQPVELAARYHHKFTAIHPFDDGNGRMSRILMNLMLMQAGYPPVVIRLSERDQYLAALRRADVGEDEDFLTFIAEHVASSLDLFIRAAEGEDVQEPTDLEKEIALLKMSLGKMNDVAVSTPEIQKRLVPGIKSLLSEIARLLRPLSEMFLDGFSATSIHFRGGGNSKSLDSRRELSDASFDAFDETKLDENAFIHRIDVNFELRNFRKIEQGELDLKGDIRIEFDKLHYKILSHSASINIMHENAEILSEDNINAIAQPFVKRFVGAIKARTGIKL